MAETTGDKIIVIRTPDDEWGEFSNQYPAPFTYMGNHFESVEQFLCYMKAVFGRSNATAEKVLECGSDSDALARTSRKQRLLENNSWEEVRPQMMRIGMRQKFLQNPDLRKKLLSTGFNLLVEPQKEGLLERLLSPKEEWIYNPSKWKERNQTGKALMQVRTDLRNVNRVVEDWEAYVFPEKPFILETPIGQMSLQEISALPGARASVHAYAETAQQYLEIFLASSENLGNISGIPLVKMERYIAGTRAEIEDALKRAKAREEGQEEKDAEVVPVTEEVSDMETAPAAEDETGTDTASEGALAVMEATPEAAQDSLAEELPDDIPSEGFYELLYDLDEMMKLGII